MFNKGKQQKDQKKPEKREVDGSRIIYLSGKIDEDTTRDAVHTLLKLQKEDPLSDIKLIVDSYGGLLDSMFAITDTMNLINPQVVTVCLGKAMSAGAFIFANGEKGRRFMAPHSTLMFHQVSGGTWGTTADVSIDIAEQKRLQRLMTEELANRCNLSTVEVEKLIDRDCFLSPHKAMEIGVCDDIITKLPQIELINILPYYL